MSAVGHAIPPGTLVPRCRIFYLFCSFVLMVAILIAVPGGKYSRVAVGTAMLEISG